MLFYVSVLDYKEWISWTLHLSFYKLILSLFEGSSTKKKDFRLASARSKLRCLWAQDRGAHQQEADAPKQNSCGYLEGGNKAYASVMETPWPSKKPISLFHFIIVKSFSYYLNRFFFFLLTIWAHYLLQ